MISKFENGTYETCDDGVPGDTNNCNTTCTIVNPVCSEKVWTTKCPSTCGNGILMASDSEECDDGNTDSGDGCSDLC